MTARLSLHCDSPPPMPWAVDRLIEGQVPMVLINCAPSWDDGVTAIKRLIANVPGIIVVVRDIRHEGYWRYGAEGAPMWYERMKDNIARFTPDELRQIRFMLLNEWGDTAPNAAQRIEMAPLLVGFETAVCRLLEKIGARACVLNASVGTPGLQKYGDAPEWHHYLPLLAVAKAGGHLLGVHEYWYHGAPPLEQPWVCGRILDAIAEIEALGGDIPDIAITELGVGSEPPDTHSGWVGVKSEQEYLDDLIAVDRQLYTDPRIVGAAVFVYNPGNPDEWRKFIVSDKLVVDMMAYSREHNTGQPAPAPTPTPTPEPDPGTEPPAPPPPLTVVCPTCDGRGWIEAEEEQMTSLVTTARLYMRTGPSKAYDPIRVLALGEPVTGLERTGDWWRVRDKCGVVGYSHGDWLKQVSASTLQPVGRPHVGAGTADPGPWAIGSRELDAIRTGRFTCIKVMCPGTDGNTLAKLRSVDPNLFIVARLFGNGDELATGARFAEHVRPHVRLLYASGVRYFECHNEPNLPGEGMGRYWQDGKQFAQWFLALRSALRPEFPEAKFGFPGLSPAPNCQSFIDAARDATFAADWLACHVYWATPSGVGGAVQAATQFAMKFAPRHVMVTEFSRQAGMDKDNKAQEYLQFVNADWPANMIALIGFVLSASSGWESETWVGSNIPQVLAQRRM